MNQVSGLETINGLSEADIVGGNFNSPYEQECGLCGSDGCITRGLFYLCHLCSHASHDHQIIADYLKILRQDADPVDCTLDTFGKREGFGFINIVHQGIDAAVIISFFGNVVGLELESG